MNDHIRAVQLGPSPLGCGVIANEHFRPRQVIAEITGEVCTNLDPSNEAYLELGGGLTLDPAPPFNDLNHSCDPNCALISEDVRSRTKPPRLFIQALRHIEPGEELRNDYAWPAETAIPCNCGAPNCRGWIVAEDERYLMPDSAS